MDYRGLGLQIFIMLCQIFAQGWMFNNLLTVNGSNPVVHHCHIEYANDPPEPPALLFVIHCTRNHEEDFISLKKYKGTVFSCKKKGGFRALSIAAKSRLRGLSIAADFFSCDNF